MKFVVMSRRDAVQYSYVAHMETSVIISICDSYDLSPKFKKMESNGIRAILHLSFDDVQLPSGASERYIWKKDEGLLLDTLDNSPYVVISEKDAKDIVSFVKKWYDKYVKRYILMEGVWTSYTQNLQILPHGMAHGG